MSFRPDDRVEVKVGKGLGNWVPARVIVVNPGCCGKGLAYDLQLENGHRMVEIAAKYVRLPRVGLLDRQAAAAPRPRAKRPKSARPRTSMEPLKFPKYVAWVRREHSCMFCSKPAEEAHHHGKKGMGQKVDDLRVIPLCKEAHDAIHAHRLDRMCTWCWPTWEMLEGSITRRQVELICEWVRTKGDFR